MKYLAFVFSAALGLSAVACGSSTSSGGVGGAVGHDAGNDAGSGGRGMGGRGAGGAMGGAAGNPACNGAKYSHVSTFGAIFDGWGIAPNSTPGTLAPVPGPDGSTASGTILEIDNTDGMPLTPVVGSAKLTIPFDGPAETLLFAQNMTSLNLQGETVSAWIKLNSGLNIGAVNVGSAFLVLKTTGAYNYAPGTAISLDSSAGWVQLSIDASNPPSPPAGYDPCDVKEIDIVIQTGGTGNYTTAVMHIDTISVGGPGGVIDDAGTTTPDSGSPDTGTTVDAPVDVPSSTDSGAGDTVTANDASTGG